MNAFNSSLSIEIEGTKVEGEIVRRTEADIVVRIIEPYSGISKGLHIPYFGRTLDNFLTKYGEETAQRLLKDAYFLCLTIEDKLDQLKIALREYAQAEEAALARIDATGNEIRDLRKQFKEGMLDQKQYQAELKSKRELINEQEHSLWGLWDNWFSGFFDNTIPIGTREDVVAYLRRR